MDTLFEVEPEPAAAPEVPELRGSDRQVDWAIVIRGRKLAEIGRYLRQHRLHVQALQDAGRTEAHAREQARYRAELGREEALRRESRASWWIARRDNSALELLQNGPAKPGDGYR